MPTFHLSEIINKYYPALTYINLTNFTVTVKICKMAVLNKNQMVPINFLYINSLMKKMCYFVKLTIILKGENYNVNYNGKRVIKIKDYASSLASPSVGTVNAKIPAS